VRNKEMIGCDFFSVPFIVYRYR